MMELCHERNPMAGDNEDFEEELDVDGAAPPDVVESEAEESSFDGLSRENDGGDEALIMALLNQHLWDFDANVVTLALQGLTDICDAADGRADAHHRRIIGLHDGPRIIAHAMERFAVDPDVQTEGLLALGNLTCDDAANKKWVFAATGGDASTVVRTMRRFDSRERIQEYGVLLLRNLCSGPGGDARLVAKAGGIQAIVRAMEAFPENAYMQRDATAALWNVAEVSDELKGEVVRSCGPELLERALENGNYNSKQRGAIKRCIDAALKALSVQ